MFKRFHKPSSGSDVGVTDEAEMLTLEDLVSGDPPVDDADERRRSQLLNTKVEMHRQLLEILNLSALDKVDKTELKNEISAIVREQVAEGAIVLNSSEFSQLVEELIDELRQNYSVVIVTHSMQQAARVSQKTAFFHLGSLVEYGETGHIFTNPSDPRTESYITGRIG